MCFNRAHHPSAAVRIHQHRQRRSCAGRSIELAARPRANRHIPCRNVIRQTPNRFAPFPRLQYPGSAKPDTLFVAGQPRCRCSLGHRVQVKLNPLSSGLAASTFFIGPSRDECLIEGNRPGNLGVSTRSQNMIARTLSGSPCPGAGNTWHFGRAITVFKKEIRDSGESLLN